MTRQKLLVFAVAIVVIVVAAGVYFWPSIKPDSDTVINASLKGKFAASTKTLWPAPGQPAGEWASINQGEGSQTDSGLALMASGNDLFLLGKAVPRLDGGPHVLRVIVMTSEDTDMQIFFRRTDRPSDSESDTVLFHMIKGRNEVYIPVTAPEKLTSIRLDLGDTPGQTFVLKEISLRRL
jgi:hypothetical protein